MNCNSVYEIKVRGDIAESWLKGFGALDVQPESITGRGYQTMMFKIVTDQSGLVGLIRQMHGLGIVLMSVRQVQTNTVK